MFFWNLSFSGGPLGNTSSEMLLEARWNVSFHTHTEHFVVVVVVSVHFSLLCIVRVDNDVVQLQLITFVAIQSCFNFSAAVLFVVDAALYNSHYKPPESGSRFCDIYFYGELLNTIPSIGYLCTSLVQLFGVFGIVRSLETTPIVYVMSIVAAPVFSSLISTFASNGTNPITSIQAAMYDSPSYPLLSFFTQLRYDKC